MKLEVGQFIRTNDGYINKIEKVNQFNVLVDGRDLFGEELNIPTNEITKASFNIIDLIKVGDYVNGLYIDQLPQNPEYKLIWHLSTYGDDDAAFKEEDIKSIVTKEQFEKMSYGLEN